MADYTEQERALLQHQLMEEMRQYGQLHASTADQLRDSQVGVKGFSKQVRTSATDVTKAYTDLTKQLYSGAQGMSVFNDAVETTATAVAAFGLLMGGPIVKAVSVALIGIAKAIGLASKQLDSQYEAYTRLADVGGIAADGLEGLKNDAASLGYVIADGNEGLTQFTSLINENAKGLAMFKGTVFSGRQALGAIGDDFSKYSLDLRKLGINTVEQNKGLLQYINLQSRLGIAQKMQFDKIAEGANKYLIETEALAAITGRQRQAYEEEMKRALGEQRFRATIEELKNRGDERSLELINKLNKINFVMSESMPELAQGFRDLTAGNLGTVAAQKLFNATNGEAFKLQQDLNEGRIDEKEYLTRMQQTVTRVAQSFLQTAKFNDKLNEFLPNFTQMLDFGSMGAGDLGKMLEKAEAQQKRIITNTEKGVKAQAETREEQKNTALSMQEIISEFTDMASTLTSGLSKLFNFITGTIKDMFKALTSAVDFIKYEILKQPRPEAPAQGKTGAAKPGGAAVGSKVKLNDSSPFEVEKKDDGWYGVWGTVKLDQADADLAEAKAGKRQQSGTITYPGGKPDAGKSGAEAAPAPKPDAGKSGAEAAPAPQQKMSAQSLKDADLVIKRGDVQREDAYVDQRLIDLAKLIQASIPEFNYFSSFNDNFHKNKASQHNQGLALDFTLTKQPSKRRAEQIMSTLKALGAEYILDEYHNPSSGSTGGHFHVEIPKARMGGIFDGPDSGYPAILHNREAVIPLPNGESVPVALNMQKMVQTITESIRNLGNNASASDSVLVLVERLNDMVRLQRDQNDLLGRMLQHQRA